MSEEESEDAATESEASFSEESEFTDESGSSNNSNRKTKRKYYGKNRKKFFRFDEENNLYHCKNCARIFGSLGGIYKHTRTCCTYKNRFEFEAKTKRYRCNTCVKSFQTKNGAYKHTRVCNNQARPLSQALKCQWCNLEFKNRGNLATHAYHLHGDSSYKSIIEESKMVQCNVCQFKLHNSLKLKYHIRKMHYNLKAKRPYAELKKVNQVWFEKVMNSNVIMEIKKTAHNKLVMRRLDEGTAIKVKEMNTETIDLTHLYPTESKSDKIGKVKVQCDICKGLYNKKDMAKHMREVHMNLKKHHCNNCNRSFKRLYQFLQHVCFKQRKRVL